MIKVTVELISAIDPKRNKILGIAEISNDMGMCSITEGQLGSYKVKLSKWAPKTNQTWKTGRVEVFDRKGRGPWDLLYLALKNCVGKRNQTKKGK